MAPALCLRWYSHPSPSAKARPACGRRRDERIPNAPALTACLDNAKFGQPEIKLGVTPGMGGSQRLTHAVGKAKAMEMCLTGRMMGAEEAERSGLFAKVVPADQLLEQALTTAEAIAAMAPIAAV